MELLRVRLTNPEAKPLVQEPSRMRTAGSGRGDSERGLTTTVSSQAYPRFDDLYEYYDPDAESEPHHRREVPTPASQRRPPSTSPESFRSLRRTPRLQERNIVQQGAVISRTGTVEGSQRARRDRPESSVRQSSPAVDLSFGEAELVTPQTFRRIVSQEPLWAPPHTRISRQSHEAILFALEAIRSGDGTNYKVLSTDLEEENARMSDLLGGDQPGGSNGRPQNGGSRAARGTTVPAGGVRTPTEVMRARRERDARKKAQEEETARLRNLEQEQSRRQQESEATAGIAGEIPGRRRSARRSVGDAQDTGRRTSGGQFSSRRQENIAPVASATSRPRATTVDQGQPRPVSQQPRDPSRYDQQPNEEPAAGPSRANRANPPPLNIEEPAKPRMQSQPALQAQSQPSAQPHSGRSSFPNAFERWETLSSHWEGLTSYWIRRMQENSNELSREPLNQQMSRQIIDLSKAGSNLFLAVFELQRLRATSDRKFQRWFFETRSELERYQGQQAELERLLRVEREERARVVSSTGSAEAERLRAEELVREMRRELQISKEEARRAWEELGRREQEERDRTVSLRSGEPTLVGGVQVVPMTQGVPSRQTAAVQARPQTRDGPYAGGPSASMTSGQGHAPTSASHTTLESPDEEERQFSYQPPAATSPTDTDPFTEEAARAASRQPTTRAAEASRPTREEIEFYQRPTQPLTSSAAIAALRTTQPQTYPTIPTSGEVRSGYSSAHQATTATSNGAGNGRFYPQAATAAGLQPLSAATAPSSTTAPARPGTRNTDPSSLGEPSYIPSTASGNGSSVGEEEYEIDAEGNYRRDLEGRRIPWRDPADPANGRRYDPASDDGSEDEYDVQSDIEREREYARRYGAGAMRQMQQQPQPQQAQLVPQQQPQYSTSGTIPGPIAGTLPSPSVARPTPSSPSYPQTSQTTPQSPTGAADYSGQGYGAAGAGNGNGNGNGSGWESFTPRHRHPTRLSDIIEQDDERSRRTSPNPSRASWVSGAGAGPSEPGSAGVGVGMQQGSAREMRERFGGGMSAR